MTIQTNTKCICGSKEVEIIHNGYSSFNVGSTICTNCEMEIKLTNCSCDPKEELIENRRKILKEVEIIHSKLKLYILQKKISKMSSYYL
jgi:hypothetical protein